MLNKALTDQMDISRSIKIQESPVVVENEERLLNNARYEGNLSNEIFGAYWR